MPKHKHSLGGKFTSEINVAIPDPQFTVDEVKALKALLVAGGGGGTTPIPNPPQVPPPDITAPVISGVSASVTTTTATVLATTNEAATVQVEYNTTGVWPGTFTAATSSGTSHSRTLSGLTPGQLYYYRVRATDTATNLALDGARTFLTTALPTLPGAPTGLVATGGNTQIVLNWLAPASNGGSAITGYRLTRNGASLIVLGNVLTYTNTGLSNGGTYTYTVAAITAVGEGPQSAPAWATTNAAGDTDAPIISNVVVGPPTTTTCPVSWATNEPATGQIAYGPTTSYGYTTTLDATLTASKQQTLTGLAPGTSYHLQILARDAVGNLALSSDRTFTTPSVPVSGPTVTVDQTSTPVTSGHRHAAYAVQRFLRGGGISAPEKAAALDFMGDFVDAITYHWSGGYSEGTPTTRLWKGVDFAPTSMGSSRVWANTNGNTGLDTAFANLDALIVHNPNAKMILVLHDIPVAMNNGFTRTSQSTMTPWPPAAFWGSGFGAQLVQEVLDRYPGKVLAVSYGQELKGVTGHGSNVAARQAFSAGATALFTLIEASHPTVERWFPHFNFWATQSSLTARANAMDALIAGGTSFETNDAPIWNGMLNDIDPDLVDRVTIDHSICDYNSNDIWAGNYAAVKARTSMGFHLCRIVTTSMQTAWGTVKPIVTIEDYFDVNQPRQSWASPAQQAALHTSITLNLMKAPNHTYEMRWEPQADDPAGIAVASGGEIASWFSQDGVPTLLGTAAKAIQTAIPAGSGLHPVTSNDPDIEAIASATTGKVFIANKGTTAKSVSVVATDGSLAAASVPAYGYLVRDLP